MLRGQHPNSQENLKLGSPKRTDGAKRHTIKLKPETVELALELGNGILGSGLDTMAKIIKEQYNEQYNASRSVQQD